MKRFIIIFTSLLILISCQDETIPNSQCSLMTLSDALPVQFWQSGCKTYNETVPKGVHEKCFCAPWNCDDEIRIQFKEDLSPDADYYLLVKDSNSEYLANLIFSEISAGIHSRSFSPETEGICDDVISLEIADDADIQRMLAPSSWDDAGNAFDSKGASTFSHACTSGGANASANTPLTIPATNERTGTANKVVINYTVTVTGTWTGGAIPIFVGITADDAGGTVSTGDLTVAEKTISANGTYTYKEILTLSADCTELEIDLVKQISSGTANVVITVEVDTPLYADPLAYSDCLDVKLSHDETDLIYYSNARNFAGLVHSDISPDASFNIRVPCRFFHEVFPEEDEAIELTSSIITTSGQLKSQKLLEVQHVPYYFHKKLQLILKHQTLTINEVSYQKEEKYEIDPGSKRWPLKKATCLLTEKNSVLRNVI